MTEIFETLMLLCFGLSWPISVIKSYKSTTAKGKSIIFQFIIMAGYVCGICGKFASGTINYVMALYFINLIMVLIDAALYFRNRNYDLKREQGFCSDTF